MVLLLYALPNQGTVSSNASLFSFYVLGCYSFLSVPHVEILSSFKDHLKYQLYPETSLNFPNLTQISSFEFPDPSLYAMALAL